MIPNLTSEFVGLRPPGGFGVILADVPSKFKTFSLLGLGKSAEAHYDTMDLEELCRMPVQALAAVNSLLWFWSTWPMVARGDAHIVMRAWGFEPVTGGSWTKRTKNGLLGFGTGYIFRSAGEPFLLGKRGSPSVKSHSERNVIDAKARDHSRKPDEVYATLERLRPTVPKIELFARQRRPGWAVWGNETNKFKFGGNENVESKSDGGARR